MFSATLSTVFCGLFVAMTLAAEHRDARAWVVWGKPAASMSFLVLAVVLLRGRSLTTYDALIAAGLVFGAIGDVALLSRAKRWFLVGLVSFLFGHIAYCVAFASLTQLGDWAHPWALLPALGAAVVLRYLWPHLGSMRIPVIAYMLAIVAMVLAALAVQKSSYVAAGQGTLIAVGALLFFVSDIAVAKARFVERRFIDRLWGLPSYYAGQLCIAWSLGAL